jgi:hypothetical protein
MLPTSFMKSALLLADDSAKRGLRPKRDDASCDAYELGSACAAVERSPVHRPVLTVYSIGAANGGLTVAQVRRQPSQGLTG